MDPNAIDVEKIQQDPMIQYPHFIKDDWFLVPVELGIFNKE